MSLYSQFHDQGNFHYYEGKEEKKEEDPNCSTIFTPHQIQHILIVISYWLLLPAWPPTPKYHQCQTPIWNDTLQWPGMGHAAHYWQWYWTGPCPWALSGTIYTSVASGWRKQPREATSGERSMLYGFTVATPSATVTSLSMSRGM